MIGLIRHRAAARVWHLLTALVAAASIGTQLVLVIMNVGVGFGPSEAGLGQRLVEFVSYFTIESNVLVAVTAAMLAVDPERDGLWLRILRVASLYGITVTLIVYQVLLSPLAAFAGVAAVSNVGLHYVVPALAILGWLLFGPHPRVSWRPLGWSLVWPAAFVVWTVAQGAVTGFYPYPFVNVAELGFGQVALNGVGVLALLLAVGVVYLLLDRGIAAALRRRSGAVEPDPGRLRPAADPERPSPPRT